MQIVNSQQLIEQIIKEHPYELGGKKWNPQSLTEQIKTGKISCLVREDENYFLYYNPRQKVVLSTKPLIERRQKAEGRGQRAEVTVF